MIRYGDRDSSIDVDSVINKLGADLEMEPSQFWGWISEANIRRLWDDKISEEVDRWYEKYVLTEDSIRDLRSYSYKNGFVLTFNDISPLDPLNILMGKHDGYKVSEDSLWQTIFFYTYSADLYKRDIFLAVYYNLDHLQSSVYSEEEIREKGRCVDIIDILMNGSDGESHDYYNPFDLSKLGPFCEYTWRSILKDSASIEFLKKKTKDYYYNMYILPRMMRSVCYLNDESRLGPSYSDKWLVEKITGMSATISFFPALSKYFDKNLFERSYRPVFEIIMGCRPVQIRVAMADLICLYLEKLPELDTDSPFYNGSNNELYDVETIKRLCERLSYIVRLINSNYKSLLELTLKYCEANRIALKGWMDIAKDHQSERLSQGEKLITDPTFSLNALKAMERDTLAQELVFNKEGLLDLLAKFDKVPQKREYNRSDQLSRYGQLQKTAIECSKKLYQWK